MADTKITGLTENTTPALTDLVPIVDDPGGSPATQKIIIANLFSILNTPRGYLLNGKIVPSVASNNLTVAIKGLDGNDPSATNPVYCRIGDTIRSITAALSVTKNAGTNWCNSGSTELATKEVDYFVYLGYNATDGVVIGFSRMPYGREYDSFSATSTAETYCAISTITNAAAGDDYELIGRFAATLSAGAGYTWTVPTFTNKNLIQRPIYETRWLDYVPVYEGFSSPPTTEKARYIIRERTVHLIHKESGAGTSNAAGLTISLPVSATSTSSGWSTVAQYADNGAVGSTTCFPVIDSSASKVDFYKDWAGTGWTGSGNKRIYLFNIYYEI